MSYEQMQNNKVCLYGKICDTPVFSHEVMGEGFYDLSLAVKRLSGQEDIVPVTISERLMQERAFAPGEEIGITGQMRSYNKLTNGRSKLILRVFVREIDEGDSENPNVIELEGFICKPPVYRTTPFKREITDMLVAINRAYNKSDYIPAIAWGRNARYAGGFEVGDKIRLSGRIQSRVYQKQLDDGSIEERTAYEVSVSKIELTEKKEACTE
jgi:single-stranded DNA-binding protein